MVLKCLLPDTGLSDTKALDAAVRAVGLAQALLASVWPGLTSGWLENAADGSILDTASSKLTLHNPHPFPMSITRLPFCLLTVEELKLTLTL